MKALIECLINWLNDNRSATKAWVIVEALARESLKRVDSPDPAQREFDVQELAEVCQPDRTWDYEAAKRWVNGAAVPKYLEARQAELDAYFRSQGHKQALAVTQRKSAGRHRAPWFLIAYELDAASLGEPEDQIGDANPPAIGSGMVEEGLIYEFTPPGEVKLSLFGRLLLGQGSIVTRSARGLVWAMLMVGPILLLLACLYLFWMMRLVYRPLLTSDLILTMMLLGTSWIVWRMMIRPFAWLIDDRIVPAAEVLCSWSEAPAQLDMAKDDKHRYIRMVRYGGVCPVCAGTIELRYGVGLNSRRLFGCCGEAPREHVFTFDRVTRIGQRYLA